MMVWERARKPEQKAERRQAILAAARKLFSIADYEKISLNGIALEAGFSQPNVYRYFATREEIFLTIFHTEQAQFVENVIRRVARIRSQDALSRVADIWVEESLNQPMLLCLLPRLMNSLEKNSSVERLAEFKKASWKHVEELVLALAKACPQLSAEQWAAAIQLFGAVMAGLWPMCNPSDNVREAMELAEISHNFQYDTSMKQAIISIVRGYGTTQV